MVLVVQFNYLIQTLKLLEWKQYLCNFSSLIMKKNMLCNFIAFDNRQKFIIYQSLVCLATLWTADQILVGQLSQNTLG